MTEKVFHAELAQAFRAAGWWTAKWPDAAVSRMEAAKDGKLRFALPRPFDLVLCSPGGRFGAIECKLVRGPKLAGDARLARQVGTLAAIAGRGGFAALALNFRFVRRRPPRRVNRAFLLGAPDCSGDLSLDRIALVGRELERIKGGWRVPRDVGAWDPAGARPSP